MLSDVDGGADEALAVHEVVEREGEVRGLLQRPLRAVERLNVPFSEPDEITGEQISERCYFDELEITSAECKSPLDLGANLVKRFRSKTCSTPNL